ncbi:hypothetical protein SARC_03029 [Sphaeroforma arctica JP610]|uniref:C2H2-type domain-containing protein n=1 Tax=Sphaeroforma arctica JP610 TaxID=667725 RepID=A0A0L0G936_9EUKA|nr:hypothetical protein SARC_03029 [Sphaeroforma arctica JP610]KNC84758.1 hypothetical protein SARC_03029 [Sphaeroforma arctica JP610]|eukprot:XP_014158660.1 hypothetical protein SARC_03029 [Sphaeroforma arctica JP610]
MQRDKKTAPSDNMFYWFNEQHHSRQKQSISRTLSQPVVGKMAGLELNGPVHGSTGPRYSQGGAMDGSSGPCLPYGHSMNNYNMNPFYIPMGPTRQRPSYRNQTGIPMHPTLGVNGTSANPTITPRLPPPASLALNSPLTSTPQMLKANPHAQLQSVPPLFPQRLDSMPRVAMPIGTIEQSDHTLQLRKASLDLTHTSITSPFMDTSLGPPFMNQGLSKLSEHLVTETLHSTASPSPTDFKPASKLDLLNTTKPDSPALEFESTIKNIFSPVSMARVKTEQVETTVTPPTPTALMAILTGESAVPKEEPKKPEAGKTSPENETPTKECKKDAKLAKLKSTTSDGNSGGDTEGAEDSAEKPSRKRRCFRELVRNVKCGHTGCGRLYATESSLQNHIRIKHGNIRPENAGSGHVSRRHSSAGEKKTRKNPVAQRKKSEAVEVSEPSENTTHNPKSPTPTQSAFLHSALVGSPLLLCSPEANSTGLLSSLSPSSDPEWSSSLLFDVDQAASLTLPDFFDTDFTTSNSLGLTPGSLLDTGLSGNLLLDDWLKMDDLV